MLEKTGRSICSIRLRQRMRAATHAPLTIRRVDAIPVALPLKTPMKMAAETITAAQNLLVRIEAADGTRRLGRSGLRADHDRRHAGRAGRRRARSSRADAGRQGRPRLAGAAPGAASRAARQRRRAFGGRDGGARSDRPRLRQAPDRSRCPPAPQRREADVAPRQQDRRGGRRRSARASRRKASTSSSSRSA